MWFEKSQSILKIHFEGIFPSQIADGGKINHFGPAKWFLQSFGQLHHVGIIVGLVPPALQIPEANANLPFQRRQMPLFEYIRLDPPPEEFDLFICIQLRCRCFDLLHRVHARNVSQEPGFCPSIRSRAA